MKVKRIVATIDVGNTTVGFGFYQGKKLALTFKVPTHEVRFSFYTQEIRRQLKKARLNPHDVGKIILSSVVPRKVLFLRNVLSVVFHAKVFVVGQEIIVPIKNNYHYPKQVGQDRLVNSYAGYKLFGTGLIIVDFGTAITFDVVSRKGEYLGGLIFPGFDVTFDALHHRAALLPKATLKETSFGIGRDTLTSINNGVLFGMVGVCETLLAKLLKKYKNYKVIFTGGNAQLIGKFVTHAKTILPHLMFEGLRLLSSERHT